LRSHHCLEVAGLSRRSFEGLVGEAEHVRLRDAAGARIGHGYSATVDLELYERYYSGSEGVTGFGAFAGGRWLAWRATDEDEGSESNLVEKWKQQARTTIIQPSRHIDVGDKIGCRKTISEHLFNEGMHFT
jgi:hypothetical protein